MLSREMIASLKTAAGNKNDVVYINNTAANGDDKYLKPYETLVIIDNDGAYTQQIYLPPVAESKGVIITIIAVDFGGGVTIDDMDDGAHDLVDLAMDADDEYVVLFNTGYGWINLATDIS